ncbi:MAG: hypothetical protein K2K74_13870 [Lachnospiraceae bacterium]|nr:hypothetical protein [Lachnospiraceae bacterium]
MKVKKFLKGFMAAALAVTMAVTPVSAVKAAPETMPDGTIFDADYYAQTYPDVANAVGTDRDSLYNHYVTFGKAEGRLACAPTTVQTDQNPIVPSIQSKDPLTAMTTPTQVLAYLGIFPIFMLTDSRPTLAYAENAASEMYGYDAYGNIIKAEMDKFMTGYEIYAICDAEGRIVGIRRNQYADEDMIDTCIYNEQGQLIQINSIYTYNTYKIYYDDLGRLLKVNNGNDDILIYEFRYDEQRRTVTRYNNWGEVRDYIYDEQGTLVKETFQDNNSINYLIYEYDAFGKLARTKGASKFSWGNSNFSPERIRQEFSYN